MAETIKAKADSLKGNLLSNQLLGGEYKMIHDAYFGTGLFSQGKGLIQHPRESLENFANRKKLAYYWNYTGPKL